MVELNEFVIGTNVTKIIQIYIMNKFWSIFTISLLFINDVSSYSRSKHYKLKDDKTKYNLKSKMKYPDYIKHSSRKVTKRIFESHSGLEHLQNNGMK